MKLTFLGTSAGKPTKERGLSAIALEFEQDSKWYLFDCGEATQFQLLKSRLSIGKLDTIFITHLHGDHFYGLPGLLASKKMDEALKPLTLYGPKGIKQFIECSIEASQSEFGYELTIIEYENYQEFVFDKFTLVIVPLVHSIDSIAFYIKEHDVSNRLDEQKLTKEGLSPCVLYAELKKGKSVTFEGKTFDPKEFLLDPIKGRKIIISGDNSKPDVLDRYLQDLDLLVHECTYTQEVYDKLKKEILHTTARDLGIIAKKFAVKNLIATHISARYHKDGKFTIAMIENEIQETYDKKLFIANDFDVFYLDRNSKLTLKNEKTADSKEPTAI